MLFSRLRPSLLAVAAALAASACTTSPVAPAPSSTPAPQSPEKPASAGAPTSRPLPVAPPRAKAARSDKDKTPRPDKPGNRADSVGADDTPEPPFRGPAWLSLCINRQTEAGLVRCDANDLLTQPSPQVKVFTRDPAAAIRSASGTIQLRTNLPYKYRFFVVP
jgi:hypothetical protein